MTSPLELVCSRLEKLRRTQTNARYFIPCLWIPPHTQAGERLLRNPAEYYHNILRWILSQPELAVDRTLSSKDLVYLSYVRHTTAWDHDKSGMLTYELGADNWRQTGTFLKLTALLPYLKWLGVTTLLLLPPTAHGRYNAKGMLGSPYAPLDHRRLEATLSEPILELDAEIEFAALTESAHRLGMRVIVELALRVTSLDCPLIAQHPEWFYWIDEGAPQPLVPPRFSSDDIAAITRAVASRTWSDLPQPHAEYRGLFVEPPVRIWQRADGSFVGERANGRQCVVPSVFADYPPNDTQPLWTDITYFRMHTHPAFNYIAYDTVRYYRDELDGYENLPLWEYIASIIPYWRERFDIDGVLLDMGHAFPTALHQAIVQRARERSGQFILIEEHFDRTDQAVRALGYDAVVGDLWHWSGSIAKLRQFAHEHAHLSQVQYLATPDTHNTPRIAAAGRNTAYYAFAVCSQLPGGIPLITSGSEIGETEPINTGLDFSPDHSTQYPPDRLPLFSGRVLRWDRPDWEILTYLRAIYAGSAH